MERPCRSPAARGRPAARAGDSDGGTCQAGLEGCPCAAELRLGDLRCSSGVCVAAPGGTTSTGTGAGTTAEPTSEGGVDCPDGQTRCGDACVDVSAHLERQYFLVTYIDKRGPR